MDQKQRFQKEIDQHPDRDLAHLLPPLLPNFEFSDEDEIIFLNVIEMMKDKISRNLKLNVHEAYWSIVLIL